METELFYDGPQLMMDQRTNARSELGTRMETHLRKGNGISQMLGQAMGLYDYKSEGDKTKDRETMTLKFCPARKTTEEKTIYRTERIFASHPPGSQP